MDKLANKTVDMVGWLLDSPGLARAIWVVLAIAVIYFGRAIIVIINR